MVFELKKEGIEPFVSDLERHIVLKPQAKYGLDYSLFSLSFSGILYEITLSEKSEEDRTLWQVISIKSAGQEVGAEHINSITLEALNAFKNMVYQNNSDKIFVVGTPK